MRPWTCGGGLSAPPPPPGGGRGGRGAPRAPPPRPGRLVGGEGEVLGFVGEVGPDVVAGQGLEGRVGWLDVDLVRLLEHTPRRPDASVPVSRFPASDIDLAFVVDDAVPAGLVETS